MDAAATDAPSAPTLQTEEVPEPQVENLQANDKLTAEPAAPSPEKVKEYWLEVSNLSPKVSEVALQEFFGFCGKILAMELESIPGEGMQVARVQFDSENSQSTALLLNNSVIQDKAISIIKIDGEGRRRNSSTEGRGKKIVHTVAAKAVEAKDKTISFLETVNDKASAAASKVKAKSDEKGWTGKMSNTVNKAEEKAKRFDPYAQKANEMAERIGQRTSDFTAKVMEKPAVRKASATLSNWGSKLKTKASAVSAWANEKAHGASTSKNPVPSAEPVGTNTPSFQPVYPDLASPVPSPTKPKPTQQQPGEDEAQEGMAKYEQQHVSPQPQKEDVIVANSAPPAENYPAAQMQNSLDLISDLGGPAATGDYQPPAITVPPVTAPDSAAPASGLVDIDTAADQVEGMTAADGQDSNSEQPASAPAPLLEI